MGHSSEYADVPDWTPKPEGYREGAMVKYHGNVFIARFWASEPGVGDSTQNGWRLHDELYDQTSGALTTPPKIVGYIPTWRKAEGFNYGNDVIYQNITHGIIAFLMFSESEIGAFDPDSVNAVNAVLGEVLAAGHRNGARILIALGGATDYGFLYLMERGGFDPSDPAFKMAAQKVIAFVSANNLDGVDLDLECWWDRNGDPALDQGGRPAGSRPHPAGRGLTVFAQTLKQAMPDKIVSAALFATSWYGNNYDPSLANYVDWLGVMTYDLTGSWNGSPVGPHTATRKIRDQQAYAAEQQGEWPDPVKQQKGPENNPILSVEDSLWYWSNPFFADWLGEGPKIARGKFAGGVPLYGYDFAHPKTADDLSGQVPPGYKAIRYKDILAQFPDAAASPNPNIKIPGSTSRPPFVSAPGDYPFAGNIYYESITTAVAKLDFLNSVGSQGVILWELSNDVWEEGKSITAALYARSGNGPKPPIATPNALAAFTDAMRLVVVNHINEVAEFREGPVSPIPLFGETSLAPALDSYIATVQPPPPEADAIRTGWKAIEEDAKRYRRDDDDVFVLFFRLRDRAQDLVRLLEAKVLEDRIGWFFVPFYMIVALFQICIRIEWLALRFPHPFNPPLPTPPPSGGNPPNEDSQQDRRECERDNSEAADTIDHHVARLREVKNKWPGYDLGPIDKVLGDTPAQPPPPAPTPGTPGTPAPPAQQFRYRVTVVTFAALYTSIEVQFHEEEGQGAAIARFSGQGGGPALGFSASEGTATFFHDVRSLVAQNASARFGTLQAFDTHIQFWGMSGEQIGWIETGGVGVGAGVSGGQGNFRTPQDLEHVPSSSHGGPGGGHGVLV